MSLSGFSIAKMRQEVSRVKTAMRKKEHGEPAYAFYESEDFSKRTQIQRRQNLVNAKRETYYRTLPEMRHKPIYTRQTLKEMLAYDRAEELIAKADQFHLTRPVKDKSGENLYSLTDELILQTIILITLHEEYMGLGSGFLNRLEDLDRVVHYLAKDVGIFVGFPPVLCPNHDNHHESLRINNEKRCYHYPVCGFSGPFYNPNYQPKKIGLKTEKKIVAIYD